jgi:transcriptional regulator with AAA-type ATPase domain
VDIPLDATLDRRFDGLRASDVWATLSDAALRAVAAAMQPARYPAGDLIIRQGEAGRHLHVLTGGDAEVRVHTAGGVVTVATMTAGACFGEMSLLSGDVTSADVVAKTDCDTLTLERPAFEALVAGQPQLLREFVRMVSRRLRESNVAMGAARRKEKDLTRFLQDASAERGAELLGKSPALRALRRQIEVCAASDAPVLIQGEPGTGKELIARLIHFRGPRREGPLLSANCEQIVETPWGDKLFGDYRGAVDGQGQAPAVSYLDLASGGTIVLKDIDSLPRSIQERLAAFVAGGQGTSPVDVRVIATSRQRLGDAGAASALSLSPGLSEVFTARTLAVPPLRDRKRDIPELAVHFARKHAQRLDKPAPTLDSQALSKLVTFDYPNGNVRELEEAIHRAVVLADGDRIDAEVVFLGQPAAPSRWAFNLLTLPGPAVRTALRVFPRTLQVLIGAAFAFILYGAWFAPHGPAGSWSTTLVWSVWWPALVLSFFFAGRSWCAVCPMSSVASATQRLFNLKWRTPAWLKRHDTAIFMAGFFIIVWAEEASGMRHSARATGVLLGSILLGAVVTSALLPRRAWCRYLCPLGGFAGLCSMSGLVELRPTADICAAKCSDHSCFKGEGGSDGCPMFNHVMFVDSNRHCVLCLDCLRICPNDSPQLNLRLPALELLTMRDEHSTVGRLTGLLAGLLVALVLLRHWEGRGTGAGQLLRDHHFLFVTGVLASAAALSQVALWWRARRVGRAADPAAEGRFWQKVTAWVPVVTAGFVAHQLNFIPGLDGLRVIVGRSGLGSAASPGMSFAILPAAQALILCTGLVVTAVVLWRRGRDQVVPSP